MTRYLGSGQVEYHEDRPIIHFGTPQSEVDDALLRHAMRKAGFETAERFPA